MSVTGNITANDLVYMRGEANTFLPSLCSILTKTTASDGQGGITETWGTAYTNVACRLTTKKQPLIKEFKQADKVGVESMWILTVATTQALNAIDRVVMNGSTDTYEVTFVESEKSWLTVKRADLAKII